MTTKVGVRGIIVIDNAVVMVRHNENDDSFYLFPGGGVEANESIFDAVKREVAEEVSLDVDPEKIVYIRETKINNDFGLEIYVLCKFKAGKLKLGFDPEKSSQVLTGVDILNVNDLLTQKWYPLELKEFFLDDIKNSFSEFRYLGVSKIN